MSTPDERIERLMVRRLDGELTEDQQLLLNRELIRNPEAREQMDALARNDARVSAALDDVLGERARPLGVATMTEQGRVSRSRRFRHGWWLVPGAVAAALLALVIPRPGLEPLGDATPRILQTRPMASSESAMRRPERSGSSNLMRTVSQPGVPRVRRDRGTDVLGVMGDDGNIYWIEVDRTLTIKTPARRTGHPRVGDDL